MWFKFYIFEDHEYDFVKTVATAFVKLDSRSRVRFNVLMVAVIITSTVFLVVALCSVVVPFQSN